MSAASCATARAGATARSSAGSVTSAIVSARANSRSWTFRVNWIASGPHGHTGVHPAPLTKNVGSSRTSPGWSPMVSMRSHASGGGAAVVSMTTRSEPGTYRSRSHEDARRTGTASALAATRRTAATFSSNRRSPSGSIRRRYVRASGGNTGALHAYGCIFTRVFAAISEGRTVALNRSAITTGLSNRPFLRYQAVETSPTDGVVNVNVYGAASACPETLAAAASIRTVNVTPYGSGARGERMSVFVPDQ